MQRCPEIGELCGEPAAMADYDKFLESFEDIHLERATVSFSMDGRLLEARRFRPRQEPGDACWSKLEDHEVFFGIQGVPRTA